MVHTNFKNRAGAVVAGAVVLAALGGVGGAAAAGKVGSLQIRDHSLKAVDFNNGSVDSRALKDGGIHRADLDATLRGLLGVPGAKGDKGDTGETGAQGLQGVQGLPGEAGATGAQGLVGETGAEGLQGVQGLPGEAGAAGVQGETGDAGAPGAKGETGDAGAPGANGAEGEKGDTGEAGAPGAAGNDGKDGKDGKDGVAGVAGYHRVVKTTGGLAGAGANTVTASCGTGEVVIGGGVTGSVPVYVRASYPSSDSVWTATVERVNGNGAYSADVFAVCAVANNG